MSEAAGEDQNHLSLVRELTLFPTTMIGVGAMIGAGIFVLTGIGAGWAGPALMLAFVLNGIATIFTAMVYAELGSSFPDAGGGYLWVKEALPQPAGFLSGWMSWYAHFVACSLYALGFGSFLREFLMSVGFQFWGLSPGLIEKAIALVIVIAFTYINYRGASETGTAGNVVTVITVTVLTAFVVFGMIATFSAPNWWQNFEPFAPNGAVGILVAMGVTFIGFEGYEIIAQSSEEVIDPKRNIPRAILISLVIVVPIYVLIAFVAIGGLHGLEIPVWQYLGEQKELAMAEAARQFAPGGAFVVLVAGLAATASSLNATIYSSSRVSFAMARDHNLPDMLGHISPKMRTPSIAIVVSSVFIIAGVMTLPIEDVAAGTVIMFKLLFLLVNVAVINLRRNRPDLDRGYIVPWFPGIPIIGIILKLMLAVFLYELSRIAWYSAILWILGGVVFYYLYSRPRERSRRRTPLVQEAREPHTRRHNVLVSFGEEDDIEPLSKIASKIALANESAVWGLHAVEVPEIMPMGAAREITEEKHDMMVHASDAMGEDFPYNWMLRATHDVRKAIQDSIRAKDIDLLVMGWHTDSPKPGGKAPSGLTLRVNLNRLICDAVAVRLNRGGEDLDFSRVVVPVRGGIQSRFAVGIAEDLAGEEGAIHLLHIHARGDSPDINQLARSLRVDPSSITLRAPIGERDIPDKQTLAREILSYAREIEATAIVAGASEEGIVQRVVYGDVPLRLGGEFEGAFIMAKKYTGVVRSYLQEFFGSRPTEDLTEVDEVSQQI